MTMKKQTCRQCLSTSVAVNTIRTTTDLKNRTTNMKKALLISLLGLTLSACGGNKRASTAPDTGQPTADITRPPKTIVGREEVQERNPEETVSFDEWRKRRLEEQKKQQQTP